MGKKQTKGASAPERAKAAKTVPLRSTAGDTPLFCLHHADKTSPNRWAFRPSDAHAKVIMDFMCEMAQLTWREIEAHITSSKRSGRHRKHHSMPVDKIDLAAQRDLRRARLDIAFGDEIFRFRLGNKRRLWGFRRDRVFHVVWWDCDHQVYPLDP